MASSDAAQALADLVEISSQIEGAVLVGAGGSVEASTYDDPARSERVAAAAGELLRAADESQARADRAGLTQLVVTLPRGAVFLVRDGDRAVAAVTGKEPTVGLVLYDLRTCLRLAGEPEPEGKPKKPSRSRKSTAKTSETAEKDDA